MDKALEIAMLNLYNMIEDMVNDEVIPINYVSEDGVRLKKLMTGFLREYMRVSKQRRAQ